MCLGTTVYNVFTEMNDTFFIIDVVKCVCPILFQICQYLIGNYLMLVDMLSYDYMT